MIKNRKIQLIYLSVGCTVGILAVLASMGLFEASFRWDFYIYYTTLSNVFCLGIMLFELVDVFKCKSDGYITTRPLLKFTGLISILLTFLMFNIIMAPDKSAEYLLSFRSLSLHLLFPVIFIADWILFYERGRLTPKYPLIAPLFPIGYIFFVLLHGAIMKFDSSILCYSKDAPLIFPYFFLDYEKQGFDGLILWSVTIILVLVALGFLIFLIDKTSLKKEPTKE